MKGRFESVKYAAFFVTTTSLTKVEPGRCPSVRAGDEELLGPGAEVASVDRPVRDRADVERVPLDRDPFGAEPVRERGRVRERGFGEGGGRGDGQPRREQQEDAAH